MTQSPSEIKDLLERHGVTPRKSLGQHFLADANVTAKIASLVPEDLPVVEVGAGTGALTVALSERCPRVVAYEVDTRLRPVLEEVLRGRENVEFRFVDAMTVALAPGDPEWVLAGNLPYNVAAPLVLDVLRGGSPARLVVMVQLEVAERLVAGPGSKAYGIPSVVTQLYSIPSLRFRVPPQLFVPPPAVLSAVVSLDRRADVSSETARAADLATAAFGQRRKMIRTSLAGEIPDLRRVLEDAGIRETIRADALLPHEYLEIAKAEAA